MSATSYSNNKSFVCMACRQVSKQVATGVASVRLSVSVAVCKPCKLRFIREPQYLQKARDTADECARNIILSRIADRVGVTFEAIRALAAKASAHERPSAFMDGQLGLRSGEFDQHFARIIREANNDRGL